MPRKSSRKDTSSTKNKESDEVKVVEQESAPRRSGRAATKSDSGEPERSRRSSTAAQTAVSVADSRVTRSRDSPSDSRRGAESPPARARSARRSTSRVNYKESDGEEEGSTPKNEENFESNEEFDDSDSDEKAKRAKKLQKSPPKARSSKQKAKSPKAGRRGRPHKKKSETIDISDDSGDDFSDSTYGEKKGKSSKDEEETKSSRKRPRKSSTADSGEKAGRRSARGSVGSRATPEPINKRPSRNKQIKKYTEVDEDFSDAKSEEEVVETKREASRKRKREKVDEASTVKKPKKGLVHEKDEIKDESLEETSEPEEKSSTKTSEKKRSSKQEDSEDAEDSEEPMEIDEEDVDSPPDKKRSNKTSKIDDDQEKSVSPKKSSAEKKAADDDDLDDSENSKDGEESDGGKDKADRLAEKKKRGSPLPKDETEDTQHSKTSSQYSDEGEESADEDAMPKTTKKQSTEQSKSDEVMDLKTNSNCLDSKSENTFPPKDTIVETSVNGENDKLESATVPPVITSPQSRNDLPPKQNGSHENDSFQRTDNYIAVRRYIVNPSLTEDLRSSLKEKTFGVASYSLRGSESINKDKLIQELSKLQASVVCLQDVPKALYHDVLESNMDVLGFKGIGSWPKGVQHPGLATFYKTSVFRLSKTTDASLQKLIEKDIEVFNMEEAKRENIFRYLNKCGNVLFLYLSTLLGDRHLIVGNAELPSTSISLHTMQISCLSQEIVNISDEMRKPLLLCGELNMVENKIPYQLLRHGSLTEGMAEELKAKVDESFFEVATFESFLKKASVRPSCKMSSCYATVLGKELLMPSTEVTSSNLVWFTPDSLRTIGVLDVSSEASNHVVSLKADVAFSV